MKRLNFGQMSDVGNWVRKNAAELRPLSMAAAAKVATEHFGYEVSAASIRTIDEQLKLKVFTNTGGPRKSSRSQLELAVRWLLDQYRTAGVSIPPHVDLGAE